MPRHPCLGMLHPLAASMRRLIFNLDYEIYDKVRVTI
jgi:hypothetical protein